MVGPIEVSTFADARPFTGVLLLDRDGVINVRNPHGYVTRWSDFRFLSGTLTALELAAELGFSVRIVSNQSCVGRGLVEEETASSVMRDMVRVVASAGGRIDRVFYCPHAPTAGCSCRKPETGLLEAATRDVDLRSVPVYLIGDSLTDIEAGLRFGIPTVLVDPDPTIDFECLEVDAVRDDLLAAVQSIGNRELELSTSPWPRRVLS